MNEKKENMKEKELLIPAYLFGFCSHLFLAVLAESQYLTMNEVVINSLRPKENFLKVNSLFFFISCNFV